MTVCFKCDVKICSATWTLVRNLSSVLLWSTLHINILFMQDFTYIFLLSHMLAHTYACTHLLVCVCVSPKVNKKTCKMFAKTCKMSARCFSNCYGACKLANWRTFFFCNTYYYLQFLYLSQHTPNKHSQYDIVCVSCIVNYEY